MATDAGKARIFEARGGLGGARDGLEIRLAGQLVAPQPMLAQGQIREQLWLTGRCPIRGFEQWARSGELLGLEESRCPRAKLLRRSAWRIVARSGGRRE